MFWKGREWKHILSVSIHTPNESRWETAVLPLHKCLSNLMAQSCCRKCLHESQGLENHSLLWALWKIVLVKTEYFSWLQWLKWWFLTKCDGLVVKDCTCYTGLLHSKSKVPVSNHHATKVSSGSEGKAPLIVCFGTRCKWMARLCSRHFIPRVIGLGPVAWKAGSGT